MSYLKDQLIRLGSRNPDLRKNLEPVIDRLERTAQSEEEKDVRWFEASVPWHGERVNTHDGIYPKEVPFSEVDDISYNGIMIETGGMGAVENWKRVLEEGPHINMTGEVNREGVHRPRGYLEGDIHVSGKIDASKTFSTAAYGATKDVEEAIEKLVFHVCGDIRKALSVEIECEKSRIDINVAGE